MNNFKKVIKKNKKKGFKKLFFYFIINMVRQMIGRVKLMETKYNDLLKIMQGLEQSLDAFNDEFAQFQELNKYYGSKRWFVDKDKQEKGALGDIPCGILSEDGFWNTLDDIQELCNKMQQVINKYQK